MILIISRMLEKFKDSKLVQKIFYGLRPASTGLIIAAGVGVATETFFGGSVIQCVERGILAVVLYFAICKWKTSCGLYCSGSSCGDYFSVVEIKERDSHIQYFKYIFYGCSFLNHFILRQSLSKIAMRISSA